jgi:hypothetical protein
MDCKTQGNFTQYFPGKSTSYGPEYKLIKNHAMKTCGSPNVWSCIVLTYALDWGDPQVPVGQEIV